jgi:predicted TPR repeat methyltransferase
MDDELERLREQSERGSRLEEPDTDTELLDDLVAAFEEIDAGDRGKTIALRDEPMAALLGALESNPEEFTAVGQALQRELDRDVDEEFDKSELLRLALRVGIEEAAPHYLEQLHDAHAEHMRDRL